MANTYDNGNSLYYPLTKMNFVVTVDGVTGTAAFREVSGIEATVPVTSRKAYNFLSAGAISAV